MRGFIFAKAAQALGLLLLAFLLLRVLGPWLVDMHNTPALVLAIVLLAAGGLAVVWWGSALFLSIRRKLR